jgi:hypothetical protein
VTVPRHIAPFRGPNQRAIGCRFYKKSVTPVTLALANGSVAL